MSDEETYESLEEFVSKECSAGSYVDIDDVVALAEKNGYVAKYKNVLSLKSGWVARIIIGSHTEQTAFQAFISCLGNAEPHSRRRHGLGLWKKCTGGSQ